jgi:hypothetical protein
MIDPMRAFSISIPTHVRTTQVASRAAVFGALETL